MKLRRSGILTKMIVSALVIYAGVSLVALHGRIDFARRNLSEVQKQVKELELSNAELEYDIDNFDDPEVIAGIARSALGLVMPGEIVFFDGGGFRESVE